MSAALRKGQARVLGGMVPLAKPGCWVLKASWVLPCEDLRRSCGSWAWWFVFALSVALEDSSPDAAFRGSGQLWSMCSWLGRRVPSSGRLWIPCEC